MADVRDPRLFDHDPIFGITEYFRFDPDTEGFTIQTQQDVEPIIEANKAAFNNANDYRRYTGEWHHVASVPPVIIMELSKRGILRPDGSILDDHAYRKWLNDPDNRFFRTKPGRV